MKVPALRPLRLSAISAVLALAALTLAACDRATPDAKPETPPPPQVSVTTVHAQSVPLTRELVGRLAPTRTAQVRARVAGIILKRAYTEGTDVKQGQILFRIDPAPLLATLHARQAALAKARADAANAAVTAKRYRDLHAKGLLSRQDLDTAEANARTTAAAVKEAQADVESARLDLGYATVTAPIAGRAGRARVTEGALVGQGQATELTTIEQVDPIYVNFTQSVTDLQNLQQLAAGGTASGVPHSARVDVVLPDGTTYPHGGRLDFSDLAADPATGAVSLRAVVPNPDHRLLPGMFVKLRLTLGHLDNAFLIPQPALQRDAKGAFVLTVDKDGKVAQRRVQTHGMTRTHWIVSGSLRDGERVIVSGLQKVRPGATAKAVAAQADGPDAASARP
ncbi:MAG TPA: efflux RND transporter periplasmic adaptor subunit [Gammaproteobacteria bacterium]|nr:efflux RND transporter periplasmic adaptor subunit [Gammaproteobacteria bacterium]